MFVVSAMLFSRSALAQVDSTFKSMVLNINAEPAIEQMTVIADLRIELGGELQGGEIELTWRMTKPSKIDEFIDTDTGDVIDYRFATHSRMPDHGGTQSLITKLKANKKTHNLRVA